jgi:hypothetical protein
MQNLDCRGALQIRIRKVSLSKTSGGALFFWTRVLYVSINTADWTYGKGVSLSKLLEVLYFFWTRVLYVSIDTAEHMEKERSIFISIQHSNYCLGLTLTIGLEKQ